MVGRPVYFWDGLFSGAMLVSGSVFFHVFFLSSPLVTSVLWPMVFLIGDVYLKTPGKCFILLGVATAHTGPTIHLYSILWNIMKSSYEIKSYEVIWNHMKSQKLPVIFHWNDPFSLKRFGPQVFIATSLRFGPSGAQAFVQDKVDRVGSVVQRDDGSMGRRQSTKS